MTCACRYDESSGKVLELCGAHYEYIHIMRERSLANAVVKSKLNPDIDVAAQAMLHAREMVKDCERIIKTWLRLKENREKLKLELATQEANEKLIVLTLNLEVWTYILKTLVKENTTATTGVAT